MLHCSNIATETKANPKIKNSEPEINERQGILPPLLGPPFVAAVLPAAAAASIGLYGAYMEEINYIYNLLFGMCDSLCLHLTY